MLLYHSRWRATWQLELARADAHASAACSWWCASRSCCGPGRGHRSPTIHHAACGVASPGSDVRRRRCSGGMSVVMMGPEPHARVLGAQGWLAPGAGMMKPMGALAGAVAGIADEGCV